MQTRSKIIILIIVFLSFFALNINSNAEEFNITAKEILIDKQNETITGTGDVQATDSKGRIIIANKIVYEKSKEYILAVGNVKIIDIQGNILSSDKRKNL